MKRIAAVSCFFLLVGLGVSGARAEEEGGTSVPPIPEPEFPAELAQSLVEAVNGSSTFSLPHLDTRMQVPANQSLVWSGSSVSGETSIGTFTLRLQPENEAARGGVGPTELEFQIESDAVRVRGVNPVQRQYLGGFRFARAANFVRRIAARFEGNRELAIFVPAMTESDQGFSLAFCATVIATKELESSGSSPKVIEYPARERFVLESGRFVPRGFIEGRIRSGILPAKARASIAHSPTIGQATEALDETLSQDPSVGVTYAPVSPAGFVPVTKPDRVGAAIRAEVQLSTPAGHQQTQMIESVVWAERLAEPLTTAGGGLEMMPKELLPRDASPEGPIYGSCFIVGGRHLRSSVYADPTPGKDTETEQP